MSYWEKASTADPGARRVSYGQSALILQLPEQFLCVPQEASQRESTEKIFVDVFYYVTVLVRIICTKYYHDKVYITAKTRFFSAAGAGRSMACTSKRLRSRHESLRLLFDVIQTKLHK